MPWESIFSDLCGCRDVRQRVKSGRVVGAKRRESFVDIVEDVTIVDMDTGESRDIYRTVCLSLCCECMICWMDDLKSGWTVECTYG